MPVSLILSLALHAALVLLAVFGLPRFYTPTEPLQVVQVSLVSASDLESRGEPEEPSPEPILKAPDVALQLPTEAAPEPGEAPQIDTIAPPPVDRIAPQPVPDRDLPDGAVFVPPQTEVPLPQAEPEQEPLSPSAPEESSPETVTEAVETDETPTPVPFTAPRPAPRPVRGDSEVTPDSEIAADQVAQPEPEAEPAPDPADPIADAIAAALADSQVAATPTPGPTGPPLTGQERDALRLAVGQCWNLGATSTEAMRVTVTVAMDMQPNGKPVAATIRMIDFTGGSQKAATDAFEAARRAILRCQRTGYTLPPEKYDHWRQIEMTFNPERMRLR